MTQDTSTRKRHALGLFDGIAADYDRWAQLLSFGNDRRWHDLLVDRLTVGPDSVVADIATGTAAVAMSIAWRHGSRVIGIDQNEAMLARGRERVAAAGLDGRIELVQGEAESLPLEDGSVDALVHTYLLRYVDDPPAVLRELARPIRPGGEMASLEFCVPAGAWYPAWWAWTRIGLPAVGAAGGPAGIAPAASWGRASSASGTTTRWNRCWAGGTMPASATSAPSGCRWAAPSSSAAPRPEHTTQGDTMATVDLSTLPVKPTSFGRWQQLNGPLGLQAFGMNAIVCDPGEEFDIAHDESETGHQEAYVVVSGRAAFTIGDERIEAGPGTVVSAPDPAANRAYEALEPGTRIVCIGAAPRRGAAVR